MQKAKLKSYSFVFIIHVGFNYPMAQNLLSKVVQFDTKLVGVFLQFVGIQGGAQSELHARSEFI